MRRSLFTILTRSDTLNASSDADEEIPRYPPFARGLPAANIDRVLETQSKLLKNIRHVLALSEEEFEEVVSPVLWNYAAYTHLLPASETHHHRGAGGLFRHGLEVAFWATQSSEGIIFAPQSTPKQKKLEVPRWRLATFLAGLLHDIGKPAADLSVTSQDGTETWNPYSETLYSWTQRHNIDRYFLRWRESRLHKRHEQFSALVLNKIVPETTLTWLTMCGPHILQALLLAISGGESDHVVANLVTRADSTSVERDMKNHNIVQTDGSLGIPVEKYLLDAMRRLISASDWLVNQRGARVWNLKEGLFVVWKQGAEDIISILKKDKISGIPRDMDTLADILIERDLAVPQFASTGVVRYWTVAPDALIQESGERVKLLMLKLKSQDVLFASEPPPIAEASIIRMGDEHKDNQTPKPDAIQVPSEESSPKEQPPEVHTDIRDNEPPPVTDEAEYGMTSASQKSSETSGADSKRSRPTTVSHAQVSLPLEAAVTETVQLASKEAEDLVARIEAVLRTHPKLWGELFFNEKNRVVIKYPGGAEKLGKPPLILKSLVDADLLEIDEAVPTRKVIEWGDLKGLVLKAAPSIWLLNAVHSKKSAPANTPEPEHPPKQMAEIKDTQEHPADNATTRKISSANVEAKTHQIQKEKRLSKERKIPPERKKPKSGANKEAMEVAMKLITDMKAGKLRTSGTVLKVKNEYVAPHTVIGGYARLHGLRALDVRAAIESLSECKQRGGKLFVRED